MNNYLYNIPNDWYTFENNELNNAYNGDFIPNSQNINPFNNTFLSNSDQLFNPKEAIERGNLFKNIYDPYNGYTYGKLKASNEKEEMLLSILMYKFALNDLNLYLDIYPNNIEYINLYKKYANEEKKLCNEYESKYGPLTCDSPYIGDNYFNWIKSPWPWEGTK